MRVTAGMDRDSEGVVHEVFWYGYLVQIGTKLVQLGVDEVEKLNKRSFRELRTEPQVYGIFPRHEEHRIKRKKLIKEKTQQQLTQELRRLRGEDDTIWSSNRFMREVKKLREEEGSLEQGQASAAAYNQAFLVEDNTGEKKIYLGPFNQAGKDRGAKVGRRLRLRDWKFDNAVNSSFIQGGLDARVRFKLKSSPIGHLFRTGQPLTGEKFLRLVHELHGRDKDEFPDLYDQENDRPTIFATEIAQAIDSGWYFLSTLRRHKPGRQEGRRKEQLVPLELLGGVLSEHRQREEEAFKRQELERQLELRRQEQERLMIEVREQTLQSLPSIEEWKRQQITTFVKGTLILTPLDQQNYERFREDSVLQALRRRGLIRTPKVMVL